jgi:hypothetical protein
MGDTTPTSIGYVGKKGGGISLQSKLVADELGTVGRGIYRMPIV